MTAGLMRRSQSAATSSPFGFLGRLVTFGFQLRVLIFRKNALRLFQKRMPASFRATGLHAFRLPRFNLALLISIQIETGQICTRLLTRRVLGATRHVA